MWYRTLATLPVWLVGFVLLGGTATRYLKLRVQADLVVLEPPATPMQIIDPSGRETEAFCTADDRNAAWKATAATLQPANDDVQRLTSTSYGFPVFNADRRWRAAPVDRGVGRCSHLRQAPRRLAAHRL